MVLNKVQVEFVTSLSAFLSVICILTPAIFASRHHGHRGEHGGHNYGVLLDAGSSSTKVNVYKFSPRHKLLPLIDLITNARVNTALSDYDKNKVGLKTYIEGILSRAKEDVPASKHAETPIFLMATAGLRFLSSKSVKNLLAIIRSVMRNRTINPFKYMPSNVRILSGEKEGAYSWIAANYLLGFFDRDSPDDESVGVLEMGGGSTQITFIPTGPLFSEEYQIILAGRKFQLYVQSYLKYGANAIKLRVAHKLAYLSRDKDEIDNPCMLKGDTRNTTKLDNGRVITERGVGSPDHCMTLLREILKPHTGIHCYPKPCAIGSVYQPSVEDINFYATQAFVHAPKDLKVVGEDQLLHIGRLEEAAITHCSRSLQSAISESGMKKAYASDNCIMGLYIPTLLTLSYGFYPNTTNIKLASSIGKERIDWSLGAMLVELSNLFDPTNSHYEVKCNTTEARSLKSRRSSANSVQTSTKWFVLCLALLYIIL